MTADAPTSPFPVGTKALIAAFTVSGVVHMVRPQVFYPLIPPALGSPKAWTYASGVAELACAAGLATGRRWAPRTTAAVLAAVWVGNWWMAIDASRQLPRNTPLVVASWLRIPLQVPMIKAALASPVRE